MKLVRLGQGKWTVLAVMTDRGECPVLELLAVSGDPGERLLADLRENIPQRGPPLNNPEASKALGDKIFELREPVKKGGTLRVLYFYDEGYLVVSVNGELKKRDKTSNELIDAATSVRTAYMEAKRTKRLVIEDLPQPTDSAGDDDAT